MNPVMLWIHKMGSPPYFYRVAGLFQPWFFAIAALCAAAGLYLGLFASPADYLQGESVRIMYIHVPSAWMSMFIYVFMAVTGAVALIWHIKICELMVICSAPIGAAFTFITLVSGAFWGRPTWGTYWAWDARLTSELFLLFLYFGVIALYNAVEDRRKAGRAAAMLAVVGVVIIPVIHYSVDWWNTLHQGASIKFLGKSTMHSSMMIPLLIMAVAGKFYFAGALLARTRVAVLKQESGKEWAQEIVLGKITPQSESESK